MQDSPTNALDNRPDRYRIVIRLLFCLILAVPTGWAALAVYYSNLPGSILRGIGAVACVLLAIYVFFRARSLSQAIKNWLIVFLAVLVWWWLIPASNNRNWQTDVAVLPYADISGNTITLHNIRNFDYRSVSDYTPAYYDKTVNLDTLETADLFLIHWGPKLIAHTIMSFGFEDGTYIAISIETRKEVGESYSAIKGFFKQFELFYVVADERDVVRLRTNYRKEDVYLYRLRSNPVLVREVFLDYFKTINRLTQRPQWYNALTHNCTTTIRGHTKPYTQNSKFDWRILANGLIDQMGYERGTIANQLPFEELRERSRINIAAQDADQNPDFSRIIRKDIPLPDPVVSP